MSRSGLSFRKKLDADDYRRMRIPERYWKASLGKVKQEETRAQLTGLLQRLVFNHEEGRSCFIFQGAELTGKTAAACLFLAQARRWAFTGLFTKVHQLSRDIAMKLAFDSEELVVERIRSVDFLVLDALSNVDGASFENNKHLEDLAELVLFRNQRLKTTVLTTRLSIDEDLVTPKAELLRDALNECGTRLTFSGLNLWPSDPANTAELSEAEKQILRRRLGR